MINYIQLFDDYSVDYATEGKNVGQNFIGLHCPWCGDSSYHGGVPKDGTERFSCWRCGNHGLKQTLATILGVKNVDIILDGYRDDFVTVNEKRTSDCGVSHVSVPGSELQWYHKTYLQNRRYDPELLMQKYKVAGTEPLSDYGARVYFPIIYKGEVVSYQGRSINPYDTYRYMTASPQEEKMFHKHLLYNYDFCKEDFIVLVEGVFDALRLGDSACATFGTQFMAEQLLLVKPFKRVFMLYDNEFTAQEKAKKAANMVGGLIDGEVMVVNLGGSKDPDDLSDDDARCLMSEFRRVVY